MQTARLLGRRFREDRLGQTAGSLTFTTLVCLVPLAAVMLAMFTAFPTFAKFQGALDQYLVRNLVPEAIARPVMLTVTQFATKANRIGAVGLAFLAVSSIVLMLTIDRALNAIWRVRRQRSLGQRVMIYWAALTLGPLVLGAVLTVTSLALSVSGGWVRALPGGLDFVVDLLQFALLTAGVYALFRFVPNTHVMPGHAAAGALFVAVAFEGAKKGLAWYVGAVPAYNSVYGAFAALPIFLLWIYLVWVIMLLGAVMAAYAPTLKQRAALPAPHAGQALAFALQVVDHLVQARQASEQGLSVHTLAAALRADPLRVEAVLETLAGWSWVGRLDEPGPPRWVWLAPLETTPAAPALARWLVADSPDLARVRERLALKGLLLQELLPQAATGERAGARASSSA